MMKADLPPVEELARMMFEARQETAPGFHVWVKSWDELSEGEKGLEVASATRFVQKLTPKGNGDD